MVIALVTIKKGLKHVGLHLTNGEAWVCSAVVSAIVMVGGYLYIQKKFSSREDDHGFAGVEGIFSVLMVITACAMAFAHGSNDVANAIGPLSAVALSCLSVALVYSAAALLLKSFSSGTGLPISTTQTLVGAVLGVGFANLVDCDPSSRCSACGGDHAMFARSMMC